MKTTVQKPTVAKGPELVPQRAQPSAPAATAERKPEPPVRAGPADPEVSRARWPAFLGAIRAVRQQTAAFMMDTQPGGADGTSFEVLFGSDRKFHRDAVEQPTHRASIEKCFQDLFGASLRMRTRLLATPATPGAAPVEVSSAPSPAAPAESVSGADPLVRRAAELFQGRVMPGKETQR